MEIDLRRYSLALFGIGWFCAVVSFFWPIVDHISPLWVADLLIRFGPTHSDLFGGPSTWWPSIVLPVFLPYPVFALTVLVCSFGQRRAVYATGAACCLAGASLTLALPVSTYGVELVTGTFFECPNLILEILALLSGMAGSLMLAFSTPHHPLR